MPGKGQQERKAGKMEDSGAMDQMDKKRPEKYDVYAPATGEKVASYPLQDSEGVSRMVEKARRIFQDWSRSSFKSRSRIFRKPPRLIQGEVPLYILLKIFK